MNQKVLMQIIRHNEQYEALLMDSLNSNDPLFEEKFFKEATDRVLETSGLENLYATLALYGLGIILEKRNNA